MRYALYAAGTDSKIELANGMGVIEPADAVPGSIPDELLPSIKYATYLGTDEKPVKVIEFGREPYL